MNKIEVVFENAGGRVVKVKPKSCDGCANIDDEDRREWLYCATCSRLGRPDNYREADE